jgi:3-hydroxyisobutyrate dehydrogenase
VIGLGKMGLPIAQNLMDRGFGVIGYSRSNSGPGSSTSR